ncbi:uncharacterized protein LOC124944443 [Impatiens glandulifera]|uniref:uncharacterized protein LOC124944443 n=1 Tax=Impatiens glandulifera TaxID=253017 RepID=UPI001FB16BBC|nr:uncharacterized protein LOC124944443 [Impatiens glandulifera]
MATTTRRHSRRHFLSDDEEENEESLPQPQLVRTQKPEHHGRRKKLKLVDEDDEEEEVGDKKKSKQIEPSTCGITGDDDQEEHLEDTKPIGEPIRVSGNDRTKRDHFKSFQHEGIIFELEDHVLITPDSEFENPGVAIIKDIFQTVDGSIMINRQWFYRPKQAEKDADKSWKSCDRRELFFSFHIEEIPVESVMHKCIVHFIPNNKPIPPRKQHPGFIVHNVYDTKEKNIFELIDKHHEVSKQHEIDLLVLKTMSRFGEPPDTEMQKRVCEHEERNKRLLVERNVAPHAVSGDDKRKTAYDLRLKSETSGSVRSNESEYYDILLKFKALTGETQRDKWLVKHLQGIQFICSPKDNGGIDAENDNRLNNAVTFLWPDAAVSAVTALERAAHETFSSNFLKYNQKMRQLSFNMKDNTMLAQRMLKGELEPSKILKMKSDELKKGLLTSEEFASKEPEKPEHLRMTEARCRRCKEKQVAIRDVMKSQRGERYQFECIVCGNTWYGSWDEATSMSIDTEATQPGTVGTVPLATAKFEDVEKAANKSAGDIFRNSTKAYMPVIDPQKISVPRTRTGGGDNGPTTTRYAKK